MKVKISYKSFEKTIKRMDKAKEEFKPFQKTFRDSNIEILNKMNSDFVTEYVETLFIMRDNIQSQLIEDLEDLRKSLIYMSKEFEYMDEEMSKEFGGR